MTGRLIVFEGADASGKSTQARRLASRLGAELTFQFGATEIGSAIRSILLDPAHAALDDRAEALLVIADKAQHVAEIVGPALERGETIVSDRYTASSTAYQGYGRGLDLDQLDAMMRFATHGIEPQDPPSSAVVASAAWTSGEAGWEVSTSAKTGEDAPAATTTPSRITMTVRFIASPPRSGPPR